MRRYLLVAVLCLVAVDASARGKLQGIVTRGGQTVATNGVTSTTKVGRTFPACTVNVYIAGTLTLATIYSDAAGTVKSNPFTASATADWFFFADDGDYDVTFSNGVIVVPFTYSGLRIASNSGATYNVRDFGAKGDAVTDDTAAIQAAVNACSTSTYRGIVQFPPGNFKISSAIVITADGVILQGSGAQESAAPAARGTRIFTSANDDVIRIDATARAITGVAIRDLSVSGNIAGASGNGIYINCTNATYTISNFYIRNVVVMNCKGHGVSLAGSTTLSGIFSFSIDNVKITGNGGDGLRLFGCSQGELHRLYVENNGGDQYNFGGTLGAQTGSITGVQITGATAAVGKYAFRFGLVSGIDIIGVDTESVYQHMIFDGAQGVYIRGGTMSQIGAMKGIVFNTLNGRLNKNINIDIPGWNPLVYPSIDMSANVNNTDIYFGSDANGPITRAYITFPAGANDSFPQGTIHLLNEGLSGLGAALVITANTIAPAARVHSVGAGLLKTITVPGAGAGWRFTAIPTAAFTTDLTGNINHASTAVIGVAMDFTYDGTKWSPSY